MILRFVRVPIRASDKGEVGIPAQPAEDCKGNPGSFRFSVFRGGTFLPQTGNWSSVKSHWNDFPSDVFDMSKIALDVKIKSSIQLTSKADTLPAQFIRFYVWKICLSVKISIFTAGNVCILHHVFLNFVDCCVLLSFRNQDKRLVYSGR